MARDNSILLKDIYEVVNRLEDKIDERFEKIEARVSHLEDFKNRLIGLATIFSLSAGAISSWLWNKIVK